MPLRNDGIICLECGGAGCPACNNTGYSYQRVSEPPSKSWADEDIVPMPYGKLLPSLIDALYPNEPVWSELTGPILCPACGSDHVAGLSSLHNPRVVDENRTPGCRWFCISCMDSWCYEREE